MMSDTERAVIPKNTVFEWRSYGGLDILRSLEDIPVLKKGEIASVSQKAEVVKSNIGTTGEVVELAVWEDEYSISDDGTHVIFESDNKHSWNQ